MFEQEVQDFPMSLTINSYKKEKREFTIMRRTSLMHWNSFNKRESGLEKGIFFLLETSSCLSSPPISVDSVNT